MSDAGPGVLSEDTTEWDVPHGTRVEIELEGRYTKGSRSVDDYLKANKVERYRAIIKELGLRK